MKVLRLLVLAGAAAPALLVGACANQSAVDPSVIAASTIPQAEAAQRLSESAARAAQAQEELARIQAARTAPAPKPVDETLAGVPAELRRPTTIEWSGPGHEAARKIAAIIGYDFRIVGNPPATPPMVSVSIRDLPAVKALEDIGNQSQPFAQLIVDAELKRMEYRFLATGRSATVTRSRTSSNIVTK